MVRSPARWLRLCALACLTLAGARGGQAQISPARFLAPATFAAGNSPYGVAALDWDDDGKLDLAVANSQNASIGPNTVSLLLGNGGGAFSTPIAIDTTSRDPRPLAAADLNHDGRTDLVVGHWGTFPGSDMAAILLGTADVRAPALSTLVVGQDPIALAITDFDLDGNLDLASSLRSTAEVRWGDGQGRFAESSSAGIGGWGGLAAGHLDDDEVPDLAAGSFDGHVSFAFGSPRRVFARRQPPIRVGGFVTSVVTADFTSDGVADVAAANQDGQSISVLVNDGSGFFALARQVPMGKRTIGLGVADFNHDGAVDLVATHSSAGSVSILLGDGQGGFPSHEEIAVGNGPLFVVVADVNGDRASDVITGNTTGSSVSVVLNAIPGPPPTITRAIPAVGGNNGDVTVQVVGRGLESGARLQLRAPSGSTIEADPVLATSQASTLRATFALDGQPPGPRDLDADRPTVDAHHVDDHGAAHVDDYTAAADRYDDHDHAAPVYRRRAVRRSGCLQRRPLRRWGLRCKPAGRLCAHVVSPRAARVGCLRRSGDTQEASGGHAEAREVGAAPARPAGGWAASREGWAAPSEDSRRPPRDRRRGREGLTERTHHRAMWWRASGDRGRRERRTRGCLAAHAQVGHGPSPDRQDVVRREAEIVTRMRSS